MMFLVTASKGILFLSSCQTPSIISMQLFHETFTWHGDAGLYPFHICL